MENYKEEVEEKRPRGGSFKKLRSTREPVKKEEPEPVAEEDEEEGIDFNAIDDMVNLRNGN